MNSHSNAELFRLILRSWLELLCPTATSCFWSANQSHDLQVPSSYKSKSIFLSSRDVRTLSEYFNRFVVKMTFSGPTLRVLLILIPISVYSRQLKTRFYLHKECYGFVSGTRDLRLFDFLLTIESSRWEFLLWSDTVIAASLLINIFFLYARNCLHVRIATRVDGRDHR